VRPKADEEPTANLICRTEPNKKVIKKLKTKETDETEGTVHGIRGVSPETGREFMVRKDF